MATRLNGISSGLDTATLVSQLMQIERKPLYALQSRTTYMQSQKTDLSSIKSVLFSLQNSLTDLTYASSFQGRIANTTDDKIVTATAKNSAGNASYTIKVDKLATATTYTSKALGFGSGTAAKVVGNALAGSVNPNEFLKDATYSLGIGVGNFTINGTAIDVTETDTLNTILNKITGSAAGVTASFDVATKQITLTQKTNGATPTIAFGKSDSSGFLVASKLTQQATITGGDLGSVDPLLDLTGTGTGLDTITAGTFTINGTSIAVAAGDTLNVMLAKINASAAGVNATFDGSKITLTQTTGKPPFTLGTLSDTSGFLQAVKLVTPATMTGGDLGALVDNDEVLVGALTAVTGLAGTVAAGTFTINGVSIAVDASDTLDTTLAKINASAAGVTASYDSTSHKVSLTQKNGSKSTITLGTDSSGFLAAVKLKGASSSTRASAGVTVTPTSISAGTNASENQLLTSVLKNGADLLETGYFSINGAFISVTSTDTLATVISKINSSATAGVTAIYDANTQKISISSKTAGNKDIVFGTSATDTSDFLSQIAITTTKTAGAEATVKVNDVDVVAENNTITMNDATFTLKSVGTATVTVTNDTDAALTKVKAFIEKYNAAIDAIKAEMSEEKVKDASTDADKVKGNLRGDYLLTGLQSNLRSFMYKLVPSLPSSMNHFSQIGISTGAAESSLADAKTGHLVLDEAKFKSALASNPQAVADLFGNGTQSASEEEYTSNGTTKLTLKNSSVLTVPAPTLTVAGITYTLSSNPSTASGSKEYSINYATGVITFGDAPTNGATIKVSYDYGGSVEGLATQMKKMLGEVTRVGGSIDSRIGSSGSLTKSMKFIAEGIESMEARMKLREETLYKKFGAMESIMSNMKNQQSWLTSQLAGLPSWKE
jgi:flagellar hook-associated protein 2